MKIILTYDEYGNLMVEADGKIKYYYCEYDVPRKVLELINKIPMRSIPEDLPL